ncbi:hypothetical protein LC035_06625 [Bacillus stratosphericus]|uniref:hypothetical protein n=1 Tax=Bacillus sp. LK10 TaxID=1628211 RepID=UPI00064E235A|nr:hypothetical protein [Bacillus sp. LK10]KML17547.1 hypothetical protein VL09_08465 [Bacillus stratosphericus]KML63926.1 hypothetical protein VL19_02890 [Bacillus stratosphericus]KMN30473.1 hypothetical protein ABW26_16500 [Bacillus stratosphericus]KMN71643.1 hypothetical protein VK97_13970 [Bacillus sp. LK10]MCA1013332.1 hypothetical protein [Bacillus stratosphericus]
MNHIESIIPTATSLLIVLAISFYMNSRIFNKLREERFLRHFAEAKLQKEEEKSKKIVNKYKQESKVNEKSIEKSNETLNEKLNGKSNEEKLMIYQQQTTIHSNVQFYVGLIMSILGFILLIGLIISSYGSDTTVNSAINIVGSLIFEGISLLFLKESQKLRIRVKELHDSVLEDYNRKEAIELADKIHDEKLRSLVQAQLAFQLIGIDAGKLNISNLSVNKSSPTKEDFN